MSIDFEHSEVRKEGKQLSLTKSEWRILSSMASYPKKVFSRNELMNIAFDEVTHHEEYVRQTQKKQADDIAGSISSNYDEKNGGWNIDYV